MAVPPKHDVLSYDGLRHEVADFVTEFGLGDNTPVDIETIVDVRCGVHIVEVPGLLPELDIDGFLAADQSSIYIDEGVAGHSNPNRYRFTLAHGIAHWYLHEAVCHEAASAGVDGIRHYLASISEEERWWFEYQAKSFAGLLLVPRDALAAQVAEEIARAAAAGVVVDLKQEVHRSAVVDKVARHFRVSAMTLSIRGEKDGIWSGQGQ